MPLHDCTDRPEWPGMRHVWITELLRWVKPRLPAGYRAYIGSGPATPSPAEAPAEQAPTEEPDEEIAVATLDPETTLYVEFRGRLIAAVELVSPRNKDRPVARTTYLGRYLRYLLEGVHLLLLDLHRRPFNFSFADRIAEELQIRQPACPPPMAVSYRVGEPAATGGRLLATWRRPLTVGAPLPPSSAWGRSMTNS